MAESDLAHSWVDTWRFTKAFIVWQGRISLLLHRFGFIFGWVGFAIMEMRRQDVLDLYWYFTIRFQERRIWYAHDGQSDVIRVAQHRHGDILFRLAWDPGIEGFIYDRMVYRFRVTQWHIWDPGIVCSYSLGQHREGALVRALLEDKQFLKGRTVISPIL